MQQERLPLISTFTSPPNNDAVQRNVALIITAVYDSTEFIITDDNLDGDEDDTVSGILSAGQSYVLYIKDNGINDDAQYASGGTLKRDGDYFIINSSKLVFASMSTDSDWQHDFVPSVNKTSLGGKFIIYAPKISSSNRDLNVFAFEDNTTITISKISTAPTTATGYTNIDLAQKTIVKQRTLNRGQDIIHYYPDGRDVMETGATYMIEANKPVSVQYGALWTNSRDGGGYVPSSNGSSSGELFYFAVPYQSNGEQEIRVVSWHDNNNVVLERYNNGAWVNVASWNLNRLKPGDWIGKKNSNATYPTVFRISCTPGKKVSVFECNWMETGSIGTSDMASMVSAESGTESGRDFLVYLLPPANQSNVLNPFTGQLFGGNFTHCYIYAGNQTSTVTIKDAKTNGAVINRTYTIQPHRYVDAFFSVDEWKSIYNGNGNPDSGPDRPYVLINSDHNVSVMNANTNDNWMMYFGSSLASAFSQTGQPSQTMAIPGDTVVYTTTMTGINNTLVNPDLNITIGSGGIPISSACKINGQNHNGIITQANIESTIRFPNLPNISPSDQVTTQTSLLISPAFNDGRGVPNNTVITVESALRATVNGQTEQSLVSNGIQNNSANQINLIFSDCYSNVLSNTNTDSWNAAWIDYNNDGKEDLFVTDRDPSKPNLLYTNTGSSFTRVNSGSLVSLTEKTVGSAWGDFNNDGFIDVFVVNATGSRSRLYKNMNGAFSEIENTGIDSDPQYFHGAAWFDMDNDGDLDLIVINFFETKFHHIYRNNGNETFTKLSDSPIALEHNRSTMAALADYDNDGLVDIYIPNGDGKPNSLFKNTGNGKFEKITQGDPVTDTGNSVGALWGDYNNDGFMDLFVLNSSKQGNKLYKNLGNGSFQTITDSGVTEPLGDTHSAAWIDHDNDGDLDLFITNDEGMSYYFVNNADGSFSRRLAELVSTNIENAMGVATADYNKDGLTDLFVATHSQQPNKLYCNQWDNDNTFINIRLSGVYSNKSAIGAGIKIVANGQSQYRQVLPNQGLGSQNSLRQHFGLGNASIVDTIEITWPSGFVQRLSNVPVNQFITIVEEAANLIQGFVFSDDNNNCVWDQGEQKLNNIQLRFQQNGASFTSRQEGAYGQRVKPGTYALELLNSNAWDLNCPVTATVTGSNNIYNIPVPLSKINNEPDLGLGFGITAWRRGFANESVLQYYNQGASAASQTEISLQYPEGVVLKWASIPWSEKIGNTYKWTLPALPPGGEGALALRDSVTLAVTVGQILEVHANISSQTPESNQSNNTALTAAEIVGAIDPNDILVTPKGKGAEGLISKDQLLRYHIRFQNVGTYYASTVILQNPLSEFLDWTSFKIEAVSHENYRYSIDERGVLQVRFDHIELPDSTTNEPGSHGFFIYTIQPKAGLTGGERIENQASIVFDYEDPLLSNTVVNTIKYSGKPEVRSLIVFPNPTTDYIQLMGDSGQLQAAADVPLLHTVRFINAAGMLVREMKNTDSYIIRAEITPLPAGLYSVIGYDEQGRMYQGKLIKK